MLRLLGLTVLLSLHPALASAQDATSMDPTSVAVRATSSEPAGHYDAASAARRPPRGWPRPELEGWRRDAEYGLRLRLGIERRAVAAENARRDREGGHLGTTGIGLFVLGAVCLGGGIVTEFAALGIAISGAVHGRSNSAGLVAFGGGVSAGVGALALIIGGIVFSQRPRHLEPGEVTLTLGPGSIAVTF